ncbi:MAG: hypothetical protein SGPRY_010398 [Prymnesium sp.]
MVEGPSLAGFFDIVRLVGRGLLGGASSSRGGKKASRSERKAQGSVDTARLRREELAGFSLLGGVLLLIIGSFLAQLGLLSPRPPAPLALSAASPSLSRSLFSGDAALIECEPLAALREAMALRLLPASLRVASLDCDAALPSGRSTRERFGLGDAKLLLSSPYTHAPSPLPASASRSAQSLARAVKRGTSPRVLKANSTLDLHRFCLRRKLCLLHHARGAVPPLPSSPTAGALIAFKGFLDDQVTLKPPNLRELLCMQPAVDELVAQP